MATDLAAVVRNLTDFVDFSDRSVIAVGAGGGQLAEWARSARHVTAFDPDREACGRLSERLLALGLDSRFTIVASDFLAEKPAGDIVLFEFSLHEMREPHRALEHALSLAPAAVVADHAPGSRWEWLADEDAAVDAAWRAVEDFPVARSRDFEAIQTFDGFAALEARFSNQSEKSRRRIAVLRDARPIRIPMPYRIALIEWSGRR